MTSSGKTVVVIGATGATGSALVHQLLDHPKVDKVIALVRHPKLVSHPKLRQVTVDFNHLEDYASEIRGDVAFSCLGTTLKAAGSKEAQWIVDVDFQYRFAQVAGDNSVPVFVLVSSIGANPSSAMFYPRMKGTLEEQIKNLHFQHTIIFRPAPLVRPSTDRIGEKLGVKAMQWINRLGLLKHYRPIKVSTLARSMISAAFHPKERLSYLGVKEILDSQ